MSFQAPFGSADFGWTIMGSAVVTEQYVRLTPAEAGHEGAIWSQSNMPFKQWEMELKFKVTGARYLGGDGFALWFTEKSQQFGSTFGNQEDFVGLGVILDTYDNDGKRDNPSISAVTSKGVTKFDHDSDGRDQRVPGAMCKINYRNPRAPVSLKVRYQDNVLFVSYDLRSKGTYTDCFRAPVDLPEAYFVGITAHTGQVADNHDIYRYPPASEVSACRVCPTPALTCGLTHEVLQLCRMAGERCTRSLLTAPHASTACRLCRLNRTRPSPCRRRTRCRNSTGRTNQRERLMSGARTMIAISSALPTLCSAGRRCLRRPRKRLDSCATKRKNSRRTQTRTLKMKTRVGKAGEWWTETQGAGRETQRKGSKVFDCLSQLGQVRLDLN